MSIVTVQMTDYPIIVPIPGQDTMEVQIMFSSSSVTLAKEEFAFSFSSLVADVGMKKDRTNNSK